MLDLTLSHYPQHFRKNLPSGTALAEAKKRVLDSLACFYGAMNDKPGRLLRETLLSSVQGEVSLWGTSKRVPAELGAWANGTCVRTLDYNDTYLSKEPCHPSDLIASLWAACELSGSKRQGQHLLEAMVLGYEVMCRLCDANSIRVRGWDHVTYLPIASAIACSYILKLSAEKTRHAIALSMVGNNAMRQTRVGTISDWKAACAAYAARSGLWAARLASQGFTGPTDIFSGKNGFFKQVSGEFQISKKPLQSPWKILSTHTKFFPAEHHAQSAIEAMLEIRSHPFTLSGIKRIVIDTFDVAVDIIGSEKEKWMPTTRETADHSMPYLVCVALTDGNVTLEQYEKKRFLSPDVRSLMKKVEVRRSKRYSKMYPAKMPTRVTIERSGQPDLSAEVILPKGYAGNPMSWEDIETKFQRLSAGHLSVIKRKVLVKTIDQFEKVSELSSLTPLLKVDA